MKEPKTCETCGIEFMPKWFGPRNPNRFCSAKCMGRWRSEWLKANHHMKRPEIAAKVSAAHKASGRFAADRHPNWKGGEWQRKSDGRWLVRTGPNTVRLRYRVVWDQTHPEDPVQPGEVIHHINHDPTDDRPENLMKLRGHGPHAKEHDFGHNPKARRGSTRRVR